MTIYKIIPNGWPMTLAECPPGLFLYENILGFKSEYSTIIGSKVMDRIDAYVCESGETFWGGTTTYKDRAALIVQPVKVEMES